MIPNSDQAVILVLAILIDAAVGDPEWLYRRLPHPVTWCGLLIDRLERGLNRARHSDSLRRMCGCVALLLVVVAAGGTGWMLARVFATVPGGIVVEAVAVSVMLAQNSLYRHVAAVRTALLEQGVAPARAAVAHIVGRDPESLDEAGVCRAAIESLGENFADGVVAPALWYLVFGLPGLFACKALNTADSMIGHRTDRYRAFGWAAARLDDAVNLVPARLAAIAIVIASLPVAGARPLAAIRAALRDAGRHRSVNAGWPEAAMAGALSLRLAGPRRYGSRTVPDHWMGDGRAVATPADIAAALRLYCAACAVNVAVVAILAL